MIWWKISRFFYNLHFLTLPTTVLSSLEQCLNVINDLLRLLWSVRIFVLKSTNLFITTYLSWFNKRTFLCLLWYWIFPFPISSEIIFISMFDICKLRICCTSFIEFECTSFQPINRTRPTWIKHLIYINRNQLVSWNARHEIKAIVFGRGNHF